MSNSLKRPIAFVLASTNHGSMLVNRHDYRLVGDAGYGVGYQLLSTSTFDADEVDLVIQLLQTRRDFFGSGVLAIDCGANVGVHTIEWAKLMHGWGEVISFEAQERIFYALAGNITLNNCFNARAIWAAVGAKTGEIGVPVPNYFMPSSFGSLEIRQNEGTEFIGQEIDYNKLSMTNMVAIDDMNIERVDFIKIDIEGMELEALQGAEKTIRKTRPILLIERIKADETGIGKFLTKLGYRLFPAGLNVLAVHETDPVAGSIKVGS